jgi:hypothetical protein
VDPYNSPQILELFRHVARTARTDPSAARQVREALVESGLLAIFSTADASDLLDLLESGGEGALRSRLETLTAGQLRDVIAAHNLDPESASARWRQTSKLIDLIVSRARAQLEAQVASSAARSASWML